MKSLLFSWKILRNDVTENPLSLYQQFPLQFTTKLNKYPDGDMPQKGGIGLVSQRRVKLDRPNYGEHDVGVVQKLASCEKECKSATESYTRAKSRLAFLQSEEARNNIQLRRAQVHQRAIEQKKKLLEMRDTDKQRRNEITLRDQQEKTLVRELERDRKERVKDKMEELFIQKKNEVLKEKQGWEKTKLSYTTECGNLQQTLVSQAKEDKELRYGRRQRIQDNIDTRLLQRSEERARERRDNEEYLRDRREKEIAQRAIFAKDQRQAAKGVSTSHFEKRVRDKKTAVLAEASRRVASKKQAATEMTREITRLEALEVQIRQRVNEQKHLLEDVSAPLATITPRVTRNR